MCPTCQRAFDADITFCPHDATELVPAAMERSRKRASTKPTTGVVAKICPDCNERYDLAITFCATDGAELVTLN